MSREVFVRAVERIHPTTKIIELRPIMPDGRWWTGLFDDRERLAKTIEQLNGFEAPAVYWTLNPVKSSLATRVTNRIGPARKGQCIGNEDIERIKWLFLDIDPKGSRDAARSLAENVRAHLKKKTWSEPVFMDSGNGYYLLYPVNFAPTEKAVIKKAVESLKIRFDVPEAIIDPKCVNPGRIARVPGTYNRKHDPRLACILEVTT